MLATSFEIDTHFAHAGKEYCAMVRVKNAGSGSVIQEFSLVFNTRHATAAAALVQAKQYADWIKAHPERYRSLFDANLG